MGTGSIASFIVAVHVPIPALRGVAQLERHGTRTVRADIEVVVLTADELKEEQRWQEAS